MISRICLGLFFIFLVFSTSYGGFRLHRAKDSLPLSDKIESPLIRAYLLGEKGGLSKEQKKIHKSLYLQHLMTPSGLHLASLLLVFSLFTKKREHLFLFLITLGASLCFLPGFDSFKRMTLFGILKTNPIYKTSTPLCFLITFCSLFWGQYQTNPLSFALSFVFLSILLFKPNRLKVFVFFFIIQSILCYWFDSPFYPLGAIYGLALSLTSAFILPLFLLESILSFLPFSALWESILEVAFEFKGPTLQYSFIYLVPVLLMSRKKITYIAMASLFICKEVSPLPKSRVFKSPPPKGAIKTKEVKNGVKLVYENKMRCLSRLKGDQWSTHCYK